MASRAKPSPCRVEDCFGRKERSLALTAALSNYDFIITIDRGLVNVKEAC